MDVGNLEHQFAVRLMVMMCFDSVAAPALTVSRFQMQTTSGLFHVFPMMEHMDADNIKSDIGNVGQ